MLRTSHRQPLIRQILVWHQLPLEWLKKMLCDKLQINQQNTDLMTDWTDQVIEAPPTQAFASYSFSCGKTVMTRSRNKKWIRNLPKQSYRLDHQASVFQRVDSAIQRINQYRLDRFCQNLLRYPVDGAIHPFNYWVQIAWATDVIRELKQATFFQPRTATGSELLSNLTCRHTTRFVLLSTFFSR